jgi:hypothetical protein
MCIRNSEVNNKQMVRINQKHSEFRSSFRRQHAGYIQERRPLFHTSTKLTGENAAEIKALHKAKRPAFFVKLDISKAFDSLSWAFLIEVMTALGFGQRWRDWISALLATSSSRVILNGIPGEKFRHARGCDKGCRCGIWSRH